MNDKIENKLDNTVERQDQSELIAQQQTNEQYKEAMATFEKVQNQRRMGVSLDIANALSQIAPAKANPMFSEQYFVEYFLPMFVGEVEPTQAVNIHVWIERVAGDERNAVDIVDHAGKVLFTVPPMFDTSVFEQAQPGSQSMTRIERSYSRLKEFDAAGSQHYLSKMLTGIHLVEKPTEETYSNIRAWNDIMTRYGKADKIINLIPLENDPNKDKVVASPSKQDLNDYELDTD